MAQIPSDQPADARERLLAHFAGDSTEHHDRWSQLWDKGDFLPWDRGSPNPALADLLSGEDGYSIADAMTYNPANGFQRRRTVLVPGCGRGYDVLLFASFGFDAYGLEISESAVQRCREEQEKNAHKYPVQEHARGSGKIEFLVGDFFDDAWTRNLGTIVFDLIYDYTFLSALPPSLRPAWSLRMKQLLGPVGFLICLEFPTYKEPSTGGPPFALPPQVYVEHLNHPGKDIPYDEQGYVKTSSADDGPQALERIAHYQPTHTHEIGKGTDWVSIWRHMCVVEG